MNYLIDMPHIDYIDFASRKDFKFISYIFVLFPFFIITGPFLCDLALCIIGVYFIYVSIKYKSFKFIKNKFFIIFIVFYFYLLIRGIFSIDVYNSLIDKNGPIFYFRYIFFILGISFILNINPNLLKYFTITFFIVILFVCIDGYFQSIFGYNFFGMITKDTNRLTGIFGKEQILGHYLGHSFPLLFALLVYFKNINKKNIIFYMLLLIFVEIISFISGDRAGFFKILQFTILMLLLSNQFKLVRLLAIIFTTLIILLLINFNDKSKQRFGNTIDDISATSIPFLPYSPGHEKIFISSIDVFNSNKIFGIGPQLYRYYCKDYIVSQKSECSNHSHNYYFQLLSELGLIGVSFLFFFFIKLTFIFFKHFYSLYSHNKNYILQDYYLFTLSQVFVIIWPIIPHLSFYNNHFNSMAYLSLAFLFYFNQFNVRR